MGVFGTVPVFSVRTGMEVVQNLPKCPVPVLMSYRTYRSVRCRYWCITKCPVPGLMYRTYQSIRYQYWFHNELTEVSGTGIDVPNLPKCLVPVYRSIRYPYWCTEPTEVSGTGKYWRYASVRTVPNTPLHTVQKVPFGSTGKKWKIKTRSLLELKKTNNLHFYFDVTMWRYRVNVPNFPKGPV